MAITANGRRSPFRCGRVCERDGSSSLARAARLFEFFLKGECDERIHSRIASPFVGLGWPETERLRDSCAAAGQAPPENGPVAEAAPGQTGPAFKIVGATKTKSGDVAGP